MSALYLLLNLGSLSIPLLFSFHPKLKFYTYWKPLTLGIVLTMCFFIPWDVVFTTQGYWGFNPEYLTGVFLWHLPLEEWLFFICIPYACIFTHFALLYYFPKPQLSVRQTKVLSYGLILILGSVLYFHYNKWYTVINFGYAIILLLLHLKYNIRILQRFYLSFAVILLPFFLINGLLTGSFIKDEVVWYDNTQNLGIRMGTIPIEDSIYAFTLLLSILSLTLYFKKRLRL